MKVVDLIDKLQDYNYNCELDIKIIDGKPTIFIYKANFYGDTASFEVL